MEQGPRQKPSPPPPAAFRQAADARQRPAAAGAPSAEGVIANPQLAKLIARLSLLLPSALQGSVTVDASGRVIAGGSPIGIRDGSRLLIEFSPLFSRIQFPPSMRTIVQATNMKIFIEITESEACICAGDRPGQKKIYSRLS